MGWLNTSFSLRRAFLLAVHVALFGLVGLTLFSTFARWYWIAELATHFRLQYTIAAGILLLMYVGLRSWRWSAVCGLVLIYQAAGILPFYIAPANATTETANLRLLELNVLGTNQDTDAALRFIRDTNPDVITVQEIRPHWEAAFEVLYEDYPYHRVVARTDFFGMAQYSKLPFENLAPPEDAGFQLPIFVSALEVGGHTVVLANIHTVPPIRAELSRVRARMLALLGEGLRDETRPLIVAGDLNMTPWSPHYRDFAKPLGLVNTRRGFGVLPTWPKWQRKRILAIPIDHVLVSRDIGIVRCTRGPDIGSDHYPLVVDLRIPRAS